MRTDTNSPSIEERIARVVYYVLIVVLFACVAALAVWGTLQVIL